MSIKKQNKNAKKKSASNLFITKSIPHGMIQVGTADDGTKIYSASTQIMRQFYPELYKLKPNRTDYLFTGNGSTYTPIRSSDDSYDRFIKNNLLRSNQPIDTKIVVYGKQPQKSEVYQSEGETGQGEVLPYSIYDPEHPIIKHNLEQQAWTHGGRDAWLKKMDNLVRERIGITNNIKRYLPSLSAYFDDGYLNTRQQQKQKLYSQGWFDTGTYDYGLVKKATETLNRKLSIKTPVYQKNKNIIERDSLIPIGNIDNVNSFFMSEKDKLNSWYGDDNLGLDFYGNGNYPTVVYTDQNGNLYQEAYDLYNYSHLDDGSGSHFGLFDIFTYGLDKIGNPTVFKTGIQKIVMPITKQQATIETMKYPNVYEDRYKPLIKLVENYKNSKLIKRNKL